MDLISLTPLAEYVDLLYTRCATELSPVGIHWWIELRPPTEASHGSGTVRLKGYDTSSLNDKTPSRVDANMHAIQIGAQVSLEIQTIVVDKYIREFRELLSA